MMSVSLICTVNSKVPLCSAIDPLIMLRLKSNTSYVYKLEVENHTYINNCIGEFK